MTTNLSYNTIKHYYEDLIRYTFPELEQLTLDIDSTEEFFKKQDQELFNLQLKPKKTHKDKDEIKALRENLESVKDLTDSNNIKSM